MCLAYLSIFYEPLWIPESVYFLTYTFTCSHLYTSQVFTSVKRTYTSVSVSVFYVLTYIVTTFSNDVTV